MANDTEIEVFNKAGLAILNNAIRSGHKKVRLNNREIEYQSINQLIKARDDYAAKLAVCEEQAGTRQRRPRAYRGRCNRGSSY